MQTQPDAFVDQLRQRLVQYAVAAGPVLLAVSGGADSVALLRGTCLIAFEMRIAPQVVHVNHRLRGAESDADAEWVRELCHSRNVPCDVLTADVAKCSAERGVGIEEAARDARYKLLTSAAERIGAPVVLLAHTADDQAETVLHHILRGTGLAGLSGMPASRVLSESVRLVRPLLDVNRTEIERFLQSLGQDFRTDSSNRDTALMPAAAAVSPACVPSPAPSPIHRLVAYGTEVARVAAPVAPHAAAPVAANAGSAHAAVQGWAQVCAPCVAVATLFDMEQR